MICYNQVNKLITRWSCKSAIWMFWKYSKEAVPESYATHSARMLWKIQEPSFQQTCHIICSIYCQFSTSDAYVTTWLLHTANIMRTWASYPVHGGSVLFSSQRLLPPIVLFIFLSIQHQDMHNVNSNFTHVKVKQKNLMSFLFLVR